jgi:ATP synthase protein I
MFGWSGSNGRQLVKLRPARPKPGPGLITPSPSCPPLRMATNSTPPTPDESSTDRSALAKYSGIALQMFAIIGLSTWAGVWLDGHFQSKTPWFTIGLTLGGIFLALYQVIRSVSSDR